MLKQVVPVTETFLTEDRHQLPDEFLIAVIAQQASAEISVFTQKQKDILQQRKGSSLHIAGFVGDQNFRKMLQHFILDLLQQIKNIFIVQIKSTTVQVHIVRQFTDSDMIDKSELYEKTGETKDAAE